MICPQIAQIYTDLFIVPSEIEESLESLSCIPD
jgi:hypothetical protein